VIYLDTSVALAHLLGEGRAPPVSLWSASLISSRLFEYEIWNRINARKLDRSHGDDVRALIARVSLVALAPIVLERALAPFPLPVRTLDAIHLASMEYLRARGQVIELASYDQRLCSVARALNFSLVAL
jgi:hypothetical protein